MHDVAGIYVFVCFYGIIVAALQCLIPPTVASLTTDMRKIGTRMGMVFSCMGFAALTGPPIGGAIQSAQGGSYVGAQIMFAFASLICAVVFVVMRMVKAEWKWHARV